VSVPCNHTFHRQCIITWFKAQLLYPGGERNGVEKGTCPCCRTSLFEAVHSGAPLINAHTWVQTLYGLEGTVFEAIGRSALRRIRIGSEGNGSSLSLALVEDVVHNMIEQRHDYEQVAVSLGVRYSSYPRTSFAPPLHRYQVNVRTAEYTVVNMAILGDISSLNITVVQSLTSSASDYLVPTDWAPIIDRILERWHACRYPRCDYITLPELHRLITCACLVQRIVLMGCDHSLAFTSLLTHGERLMLEAQQQVASGNLSEAHLREYYRMLDYTDNQHAGPFSSQDSCLYLTSNLERIRWIVKLRRRTRGQNAGHLTPS
jgi:hypothetical protein